MKSLFIWICLFLTAFTFFVQGSARATTQATKSVLGYDVYAGGIHAMNARLTIVTEPTKYDVSLFAETQGLLKKLANWSGKFTTYGLFSKGVGFPLGHQSASTWKGSTEAKTFEYDGKGHFVSYKVTEDGKDKTPKDVDLDLAKGTIDTLSATLHLMMTLPADKACAGKELIFDGDRNFRLVFGETKTERLQKNDYNIYSGEAILCTVEVIPEKGKWRKKPRGWLSIQEQGRNKGGLPTIWFGQIKGRENLYVPVKIRIKTDYGTLFMHLTSVETH